MMNINEKQDELIADFETFEDWMTRYEYIIDLGKSLPLIAPEFKKDENLIHGCQSQVWLHHEVKDGKVLYTADSDAVITKGLISLLVNVLSGHKPAEIASADLYFIEKTGLQEHLSPTRSNGLRAMVREMKLAALAATQKT